MLTTYVEGVPGTVQDVSDGYGVDGDATMSVGSFAGTANFWTTQIAYVRYQSSALTFTQIQQEVGLFQGILGGATAGYYDLPTFQRSTTSTVERKTGTYGSATVPANWAAKSSDQGNLIEGAVENLFTFSQSHATGGWSASNCTLANNDAGTLAPDGTQTATKFTESNDGVDQVHNITSYPALVAATNYVQSHYLKYKTGGREWVIIRDVDANKSVWFNIRYGYTGTVDVGVTANISALPNGWFRISAGFASVGTGDDLTLRSANADNVHPYTGNGRDCFWIWGSQLQTGLFPTSYYPTTTVKLTRSADSYTFIPWRISKDLSAKVNATPKLKLHGDESLNSTSVTLNRGSTSYSFTKNGRPQNGTSKAEGAYFQMNGSSDWLSLPDASGGSDFDFSAAGQKFSVTVTYTPMSITGSQGIIDKWNDSGVDKRQWMIYQSTSTINFFVSKNGLSGGGNWSSLNITGALEVGKPVMITATYDGTLGDGNAVMWLYVDAATAAAPVYQASSTTAVAPIYNSDADLKVGAWSTNYFNGKIHYTAVYDGHVTTLAEHQAMYAGWKHDGILPLTMSATSAQTKLIMEWESKAQWSSATDIGSSDRTTLSIGGYTGVAFTNKNYVQIYTYIAGNAFAAMYANGSTTRHSISSAAPRTGRDKWETHKFTIDFANLASSTYYINGVAQTSFGNMSGSDSEIYFTDSLIRIGQAASGPGAGSAFTNVRNVKLFTE
jgi:hypothetical protein